MKLKIVFDSVYKLEVGNFHIDMLVWHLWHIVGNIYSWADMVCFIIIISAKWMDWTGEILCDAFFLSVLPSVRTQYLDANISKTVWVRDWVPITH